RIAITRLRRLSTHQGTSGACQSGQARIASDRAGGNLARGPAASPMRFERRCRIRGVTLTPPWPEAQSTRGLVATPHVLASEAGVAVMKNGGNALDAAIAAAATIAVVYPHMNGIGVDNVWLIYDAERGRLRGLNAAGRAAASADRERYRAR